MSHCGWNSCMEAMTRGVAIAAWPIHSDQPRNAFLLVDVLKVALFMREWACRDELLTSVMVEKVVRKLMDTKEGAAVRRRAVDLGGELRRAAWSGIRREVQESKLGGGNNSLVSVEEKEKKQASMQVKHTNKQVKIKLTDPRKQDRGVTAGCQVM
ncbi:hypothetical protein L1987_22486 [Smallanthus sonchifolius]|uniref:Uncharacterized protein n=1 Tax=Smallanthus sonchifolius TaxID=185202 RepID=A0ACB9IHN5_9ASTR|nr:hypothetical protein L1987_22486 [Smallanthus sonchifolius]